jgi:hypothetical protein
VLFSLCSSSTSQEYFNKINHIGTWNLLPRETILYDKKSMIIRMDVRTHVHKTATHHMHTRTHCDLIARYATNHISHDMELYQTGDIYLYTVLPSSDMGTAPTACLRVFRLPILRYSASSPIPLPQIEDTRVLATCIATLWTHLVEQRVVSLPACSVVLTNRSIYGYR